MKSEKALLGILVGFTAGAVIGVLFAPDKGSTTRKKIVTKGNAVADDLSHKFDDFISTIKDQFETILQEATRITATASDKAEDVAETVTKAAKGKA